MYNSKTVDKKVLFGTFLLCIFLLLSFHTHITRFQGRLFHSDHIIILNATKYLVDSQKCKIIDLDPFTAESKEFFAPGEYLPCTPWRLLTYVTKNNNQATLHVDKDLLPFYSPEEIRCYYASITRGGNKSDPDNSIRESKYVLLEDNVTLTEDEDVVAVTCVDVNSTMIVYENVHAVVTVKKHLTGFDKTKRPLSLLFIGIDSVSRLHFIRAFPNSHKFLMENNWISLRGYNKIDDNTFPNLMAILSGYASSFLLERHDLNVSSDTDRLPNIWKDLKKLGYVTAYAEDESWMSTFNYQKVGFEKPPTDYYFRPYFLKSETLQIIAKDNMKYCTGPETAGERVLNVAKDFATTFKNRPNFGLFWMNSFSHNDLNSVGGMDDKIRHFLQDITEEGILESSIVVFFSDHGMRFGAFRNTITGWLEDRLPFIYIWIPESFKEEFPSEYSNLRDNSRKLTSPFDLYLTLQHFLLLSNLTREMKSSQGCPTCRSLFTDIPSDRSCEEAGITPHWCTCSDFSALDEDEKKDTNGKAVTYFIDQIHNMIHVKRGNDKCMRYSLHRIVKTAVSKSYDKKTFILLLITTEPKALFETTLSYDKGKFNLRGGISRTDRYDKHSYCVGDPVLKKYCYCKNTTTDTIQNINKS